MGAVMKKQPAQLGCEEVLTAGEKAEKRHSLHPLSPDESFEVNFSVQLHLRLLKFKAVGSSLFIAT